MEGVTMTSGVDITVMDTPTIDTTTEVSTSTMEEFEMPTMESPVEIAEPVDIETSMANQLLETAKENGITASLEQLAGGDFEETEILREVFPENEEQSLDEIEEPEAVAALESDSEMGKSVEKPVSVQIDELRKEIDDIKANFADKEALKIQLEALETLERVLLLIKLLQDEEKNKGVDWGKIMGIVGDLIILMFVPESEKKKSNETVPEQPEKLPDNVFELLKYYRERRKVIKFPTAPRIENQAA